MSMYTIERRPTTLGTLRSTFNPALSRHVALPDAIRQTLATQLANTPASTAVDPYAHQQVDYLPLGIAGVAGFALGAAGIVLLLKRRGSK